MIRYNTKEDKLEMSYEDICMTLHDCSDTLDCSTGYGGTYETIVDYIDKLQNNWNELKKWLENEIKIYGNEYYGSWCEKVLEKLQELEENNE